jgi:hypothetical protein
MCHASRLTDDQQIEFERWSQKWQKEFERRTNDVTFPDATRKTREVFTQIEAEMGKSAERILEAATR